MDIRHVVVALVHVNHMHTVPKEREKSAHLK